MIESKRIYPPVRKIFWDIIAFFAVTTFGALAGVPLYAYYFGISAFEIGIFLFFSAATALSITVGYHRLFAHASYRAHPAVRFLLLFFGAAAFQQSALKWASQHRDHHRYTDTDRDPYNIKEGFFYAHMGWLMFREHGFDSENSKDLLKDPMVVNQHRHYGLWAVASGLAVPLLVGAACGHLLGAFIFGVCLRITVVYHSTFFINSVCHMFGNASYDRKLTARDHWLVALLTFGEGYHNFHHRFPSDYRNGVRWYHWDPSKWVIALLGRVGLAKNLMRVSEFRIVEARLAAERVLLEERLQKIAQGEALNRVHEELHLRYRYLRALLGRWERAHKERLEQGLARAAALKGRVGKFAGLRLVVAKRRFKTTRVRWSRLLFVPPRQIGSALSLLPASACSAE